MLRTGGESEYGVMGNRIGFLKCHMVSCETDLHFLLNHVEFKY